MQARRYRYDSEPPSRTIAAFRQLTLYPAQAVAFAHAVQTAPFRDGHDPNDPATYNPCSHFLASRSLHFSAAWLRPTQPIQQKFAAVVRIGAQGFPASVLRIGEQGNELLRQDLEQLLEGERGEVRKKGREGRKQRGYACCLAAFSLLSSLCSSSLKSSVTAARLAF